MSNTINLNIGEKVKVVNFHGEVFPLTNKLGVGYIRSFYTDCGEQRAEVFFPRLGKPGGYPVEMLKSI
jgi:hypothetical protein